MKVKGYVKMENGRLFWVYFYNNKKHSVRVENGKLKTINEGQDGF
jgi:hypothetical protein